MSQSDPCQHVIYRGCTHPATFLGMPVVAFVVSVIAFALPGFWLLPFRPALSFGVWLMYVPVFVGMKVVSRRDPHALTQMWHRYLRRATHRNRGRWGALTYSPLRFD